MNNTTSSTNRILARDISVSNDTYQTRLNNNDLIIGATGTGKTTGYVIPNIIELDSSMIVADTKGNLCRKLGPKLREKGFIINVLDFMDPEGPSCYNPLEYIRRDKKTGRFVDQDIMSIAYALLPDDVHEDSFWTSSSRMLLSCLISYVLEAFEPESRNMPSVADVLKVMITQFEESGCKTVRFLDEWTALNPDTFAARKYQMVKGVIRSEKTWACIQQFVAAALDTFDYDNGRKLFSSGGSFNLHDLGKKKSVLFLNVSDTDHSLDSVINILYTQAFQVLCADADSKPTGRLDVPVRIILDDFATNVNIHDFDKLISVIRSREISVSIIIQSISQLDTLYSKSQALTIINGCDHILYLGGNDLATAEYIAARISKTVENVLYMPNEKACLLTRGAKGGFVDKYIPDFSEQEPPPENDDFDSLLEDIGSLPF